MEAVILGGTGLVGGSLIEELVGNSNFSKIVSIGRNPIKTSSSKISNIVISDLSEISKIEIDSAEMIFFCCIGSTIKKAGNQENFRKVDYTAVVDFAELAKKYNVSKFLLVSAKGADSKSAFFYNKTKGDAEDAIIKLGLKSVTIYRPGLLLGDRNEFRFFELVSIGIVKGLKSVLGYDRLKPIVTSVKQLVHSMVDDSLAAKTGHKVVDSSEI